MASTSCGAVCFVAHHRLSIYEVASVYSVPQIVSERNYVRIPKYSHYPSQKTYWLSCQKQILQGTYFALQLLLVRFTLKRIRWLLLRRNVLWGSTFAGDLAKTKCGSCPV